jgi:hypothetical protein
MTPLFAHLGHWYVGLPVYLSPVLVVVALLKWSEWREKRRKRQAQEPPGADAPD